MHRTGRAAPTCVCVSLSLLLPRRSSLPLPSDVERFQREAVELTEFQKLLQGEKHKGQDKEQAHAADDHDEDEEMEMSESKWASDKTGHPVTLEEMTSTIMMAITSQPWLVLCSSLCLSVADRDGLFFPLVVLFSQWSAPPFSWASSRTFGRTITKALLARRTSFYYLDCGKGWAVASAAAAAAARR